MKKILALLLAGMMCLVMCACDNSTQEDSKSDETTPVTEETTPVTEETTPVTEETTPDTEETTATTIPTTQTTIDLTTANIEDYLTFKTDFELSEKVDSGSFQVCWGDITIETSRMQNVEFENLKITVGLKSNSTGYGWDYIKLDATQEEFCETLRIPFDGAFEETYHIKSEVKDFVSSNPEIDVEILSVTGTAKK